MTNTRNNRLVAISVACALTMALAGVAGAQAVTRLQVLVTSDRAKAEATLQELDKLGSGPGLIAPVGNGTFKVMSRGYSSLAEANFAKPALKNAGFMGAFAVTDQNFQPVNVAPSMALQAAPAASNQGQQLVADGPFGGLPSAVGPEKLPGLRIDFQTTAPAVTQTTMTDDLKKLDDTKASESQLAKKALAYHGTDQATAAIKALDTYVQRFPKGQNVARVKLQRAYWSVALGDPSAAREQFELVVKEHAGTTEAGEAQLRCAYLMLKAREPETEYLKRFLAVARGDVKASVEVRMDAMLRCAALYHRGKDLETAEACYAAIEKASTDPELCAFAQMNRAGIVMERAWNRKATFADAVGVCDDLLQRYPKVHKQTRATAALMAMESQCYQKKYTDVLKRHGDFKKEFADTPENMLGNYWLGVALSETGQDKLAADVLEEVVAADLPSEQRFKEVSVTQSARRLAAKVHTKMGNTARAQELMSQAPNN